MTREPQATFCWTEGPTGRGLGDGNSLAWPRLPEGDWLLISPVARLLAEVRSPASVLPASPLCRVWGRLHYPMEPRHGGQAAC